ncbi:RrF2 family transcriptional regulator [Desulfobaculum senezii]
MRISTRSRYGLRMVLDIAVNGQSSPVRIHDVAARQGLSVKYLEKLIRILKDHGFILSKRGPRGGHMLALPQEDLHIGNIVSALEGDRHIIDCTANPQCCEAQNSCPTRKLWDNAARSMFDTLNAVSVADMVKEISRAEGLPSGPASDPTLSETKIAMADPVDAAS